MKPRVLIFGATCSMLMVGCSQVEETITIEFPTVQAMESTTVMAVTAFEPFIMGPDAEIPEFVSCDRVGVFPPPRDIDPDTISTFPNLGEVLSERESRTFPFEDNEFDVSVREVKKDNPNNPWGAVMVYIEARGEVRAPDDQGGGQVSATLLAGCYCIRTLDGNHINQTLDREVSAACSELTSIDKTKTSEERVVKLEPVALSEFRLEACGVQNLTAPKLQPLSPGPSVCINTTRCDDAPSSTDCFKCGPNHDRTCDVLDDKRNVPIRFTIDQPGGNSTPASQIVLSDTNGHARGDITVDDCKQDIHVRAQILGRQSDPVSFSVQCVEPVDDFECQGESQLTANAEPMSITKLPGAQGGNDYVAVLSHNGTDTFLDVINPMGLGDTIDQIVFPGENGRVVHGFYYNLGSRIGDESDPLLAVVTTDDDLIVRIYRWGTNGLEQVDRLDKECNSWLCGSRQRCANDDSCTSNAATPDPTCDTGDNVCSAMSSKKCFEERDCLKENCVSQTFLGGTTTASICITAQGLSGQSNDACGNPPPVRCGCKLRVEFQTEVSVATADLDRDEKSDLAITTSSGLPITVYYTSLLRNPGSDTYYQEDACLCGQYAQAPTTFELLNFGGPGEGPIPQSIDLIIGAPGGAFVKYAQEVNEPPKVLSCGQPSRIGDLVPVRDVVRGRFQCNPFVSTSQCEAYEDIVIVAAKSLGGGSFDDPGTIRVVFGANEDLAIEPDLFARAGTNVELIPKPIEDRGEPRDPRTAEVGDFNGDGHDDLAVLFGSSEEIHVWLGGSNKGLGEVSGGIVVEKCQSSFDPGSGCPPLRQFAVADFNADGQAEVAVVCEPSAPIPRLRWFSTK